MLGINSPASWKLLMVAPVSKMVTGIWCHLLWERVLQGLLLLLWRPPPIAVMPGTREPRDPSRLLSEERNNRVHTGRNERFIAEKQGTA